MTLGCAEGVFNAGDIVHLRDLFTALGHDEAGRAVEARIRVDPGRVHVHAAVRAVDHPRVVVVVDAEGRRTIIVPTDPIQPAVSDPLPWSTLVSFDAAYFTRRRSGEPAPGAHRGSEARGARGRGGGAGRDRGQRVGSARERFAHGL